MTETGEFTRLVRIVTTRRDRMAVVLLAIVAGLASLACGAATTGEPGAVDDVTNPATHGMEPLAGQAAVCAGPRQKTFELQVVETTVDLGMGRSFAAWTYGGRVPGPTLEACEGDSVTIRVVNRGTTSHGLDSHAFKIDAAQYGPTPPGTTLTFEREVDTPGAYMYHCAAGPVTDYHIKSGLHGAMIVYPRTPRRPAAKELVVVQDAIFGTPDDTGHIPGTDPGRSQANDPHLLTFNGRLGHDPIEVAAGDLVRLYFVNIGPGVSAVHVIGSIFERVYDGQIPLEDVQTYGVPPGSGVIFEVPIPESGDFVLVDHDRLAYLPWGLAISFSAE